ncbi:MAG: alkaline shock response membrane anchor protein AmaP [Firmicutes bacterium]|nr:alkaline shock response membrane anchor protein AmaP [Bacillota bacterium]MDD4263599.1 alkaline shock response membrane anchor protein AmaP [Bacillota bacterium]MDD4693906.1 alkaline shock response membrane anchor protein AmaP [Bacillota bacterium]
MNWLDKVLIFLASLVLAVLGITTLLIGLGVDFQNSLLNLYAFLTSTGLVVSFVTGALLCVIAFYLAGRWLGTKEEEVGIVAENEIGRVNISERVVKAYSDRAAQSIDGVVSVRSRLRSREDGLHIFLDLTTKANIKTAEIARMVQERVLEYVADSLGTKVSSVEVRISGVEESKPQRVS